MKNCDRMYLETPEFNLNWINCEIMNFHLARYSYPNIRLHRIYSKMSDTISNKFNTGTCFLWTGRCLPSLENMEILFSIDQSESDCDNAVLCIVKKQYLHKHWQGLLFSAEIISSSHFLVPGSLSLSTVVLIRP